MVRKVIWIFTLILCLLGCEGEFSSLVETKPTPVVYAIFNVSDSINYVRLTRTFQSDANILENEILPDSLVFKNAELSIERWHSGNLVSIVSMNPEDGHIREDGFFPKLPVQIFSFQQNDGRDAFFKPFYNMLYRLIIDIPDQPVVYSEFNLFQPLDLWIPNSNGRSYNMFDFQVKFITYAPYNEMFMRLHYVNQFPDSSIHETSTWREYHMYDPDHIEYGKEFTIRLEGMPLYEKIGNVIPDIEGLSNRRLEYAELIFNGTDENLYRYNNTSLTMPSDQAGRPYTNVVNGIGIVGSKYTVNRTFLFDYRSLSELCEGEYTKHLKFVLW